MKWAIYCAGLDGWLVDTSFVWSFDVSQCQEFESITAATEAVEGMINNGHSDLRDYWFGTSNPDPNGDATYDVLILRVR